MTYNFDPDRWYEDELGILDAKYKSDRITEEEYKREFEKLHQRYEEMWDRLDGSYQLPH